MIRRTTVEIDDQLLSRAKSALGETSIRTTIEKALLLAAESAEDGFAMRAEAQRRYLRGLAAHVDLEVLGSDEMWR